MPTLTITQSSSVAGGTIGGKRVIDEGMIAEVEETIAADTTVTLNQAIDVSELKAIAAIADISLELNFAHAGGPTTILLAAGVPFVWHNESGLANPFAADITAIEVINASETTAATLKMQLAVDPTP